MEFNSTEADMHVLESQLQGGTGGTENFRFDVRMLHSEGQFPPLQPVPEALAMDYTRNEGGPNVVTNDVDPENIPPGGATYRKKYLLDIYSRIRLHELPGERKVKKQNTPEPMWSKIQIDEILHTMENTPTRVRVIEWAKVRLKRELGLEIIQNHGALQKTFPGLPSICCSP
ncbi:hypothetical protein R1sor_003176 [Riccia sorocarpa]|uniref:Uncharacterized protein n=1 Tax=Riccia sorocarpa TaxID=122646 RepID=A0ABD3H3N1_9MARC